MVVYPTLSVLAVALGQLIGGMTSPNALAQSSEIQTSLEKMAIRHRTQNTSRRPLSCRPEIKNAPPGVQVQHPTPEASRLDTILSGIQKFYGQTVDLKSDFTQTYTYKVYNRKQISKGRVFFKKPGMMRWDYAEPTPKVFVADGKTLWVYEPTENQVFKRDLKSAQLPVALAFMSGEGELTKSFEAKLKSVSDDVLKLELLPRNNEGDYKMLLLEVDAKSYAVQSSTVIDPLGNTNHIVFDNVVRNANLPASGFEFSPPAGVRIIQGPSRPAGQ